MPERYAGQIIWTGKSKSIVEDEGASCKNAKRPDARLATPGAGPSIQTIQKLARALGVPVAELLE